MRGRTSSSSAGGIDYRSVALRFALLVLAFLIVVAGSVSIALRLVQDQRQQALLLDQARRQRDLVETIAHEAAEYAHEPILSNREHLSDAAAAFAATLDAWQAGRYAPRESVAPLLRDSAVAVGVASLALEWRSMQGLIDALLRDGTEPTRLIEDLSELQTASLSVLESADGTVLAVAEASDLHLRQVLALHIALVALALALPTADFIFSYRHIVGPFHRLEQAAERIGRGDLDSPVVGQGSPGMMRLAASLELMRAKLRAARDDLERQVKSRTQELAALHEVSQELAARLDTERLLDLVVKHARSLLNGEYAALCLLDDQGTKLELSAFAGIHPAASAPPALGRVIATVDGSLPGAALSGAMFFPGQCFFGSPQGQHAGCPLGAACDPRQHITVPVKVEGRLIGALCVAPRASEGAARGAEGLLQKLADAAAVALNNARLYARAERAAALEERERLAAEMHDGLAQTLSYLHLQVDQALGELDRGLPPRERLSRVRSVLAEQARDIRSMIATLRNAPAGSQALAEWLRVAVELAERDAGKEGGLAMVRLETLEELTVQPAVASEVQGVVREALTNALRHSGASRIDVRLGREAYEACVEIEDNGQGFDSDRPAQDGRMHFGLSIMAARAMRIKGRLAVDSRPGGGGTRISLAWPLEGMNDGKLRCDTRAGC